MVERSVAATLLLLASACVLPADEPTGLELSWRLIEVNTVDGEDAQRLRTCAGGHVDEVVFEITDGSDAERSEIFRYPCSYGYQTVSQFQTESSDAFIELKPRGYAVTIDIVGTTAEGEEVVRRARDIDVDVLERTVTLQDFDFGLEPVELTLTLEGIETCEQLALSLRYDNPEAALAEPPLGDDGIAPTSLLYRENLTTELGVSLAGTASACADLDSTQRVLEVDPGNYTLDVDADGVVCPIDITVGLRGAAHVIDLANLPCDG